MHQLGDKAYRSRQTPPMMPLTFLLCLERGVHTSLYCIISVNVVSEKKRSLSFFHLLAATAIIPNHGSRRNTATQQPSLNLSHQTYNTLKFTLSSTLKRVKSEPLELGKYCKNLQACYITVKKKRSYNRRDSSSIVSDIRLDSCII